MNPITIERRISAPIERVWAVLTDLDNAPGRISTIESIERLAGPEFGVGTRAAAAERAAARAWLRPACPRGRGAAP